MRRLLLGLALPTLAVLMVPSAAAEPVPVEVGLHLISFGNYDFARGTYQMDFYLWMRWNESQAPAGFSAERFEFVNGRAAAKELLSDVRTDGTRELFYRVNTNLYSEPYFAQYPYDHQRLAILIEDSTHTLDQLVYVPLRNETRVDGDVRVAGWRIQGSRVDVAEKAYPFGESYSRLVFELSIRREPVSTSLKTFLPPLAFMLVSGLSFFFEPSKSAQRVALGTGMLISAVMFHVSQTVSLPPVASLMLFDKIMISVYAFLAASLVVTTLIVIDVDHRKNESRAKRINRYGAVAALLMPAATFLVLLAF